MFKKYANLFKDLKIAYAPYSKDFLGPGDRRRFCFFARELGIKFDQFEKGKDYDLVIFSSTSDLNCIDKLKQKKSKIVLDLVDSYLIKTPLHKDLIRYIGRSYLQKRFKNVFLPIKYTNYLKKYISKADAIVCSTEKQLQEIKRFNPNVHIILDNMDDDIIQLKKNFSSQKNKINIMWEGLPSNIYQLKELNTVLNNLGKTIDINLHVLTDLESYRFFSRFYKIKTQNIIDSISLKINVYLYQWNSIALSSIASICDFGIIPVDQKSQFTLGKPENKLILLWKLGLPVFTSKTDAYSRVMQSAGLENMICENQMDWEESIKAFIKLKPAEKFSISESSKVFANERFNKKFLISLWMKLFSSILD